MYVVRFLGCCWLFFAATANAQDAGAWLGDLSWPETERRYATTPVVIVPLRREP